MILATFADGSTPRLGVVRRDAGTVVDLACAAAACGREVREFRDMLALIEGGPRALEEARRIEAAAPEAGAGVHAIAGVRLLAPIPVPPQIRDFSTYEQHMRQAGAAMARLRARRTGSTDPLPRPADIRLPEVFFRQPVYYKANRFNVVGHDHDVAWPSYCELLDYELEICAIVGRTSRDVPEKRALAHIFGYTIFDDFSARDAQELEMNCPFGPAKGKDFDTGNAMGPWIVTADEIGDPQALEMSARVNGEEWSRGNTAGMVHGFAALLAHAACCATLHPGEMLGSGTVGGGCGLELDRWLAPGDVVELEVAGIGTLRNRVIRAANAGQPPGGATQHSSEEERT